MRIGVEKPLLKARGIDESKWRRIAGWWANSEVENSKGERRSVDSDIDTMHRSREGEGGATLRVMVMINRVSVGFEVKRLEK